jgi:hypothetical protein
MKNKKSQESDSDEDELRDENMDMLYYIKQMPKMIK